MIYHTFVISLYLYTLNYAVTSYYLLYVRRAFCVLIVCSCDIYLFFFFFFFFSSRRRHTRCSRDWSSDVCSSDLVAAFPTDIEATVPFQVFIAVLGLGIAAATVSVLLRFRRSRGEERQQLKWFAYASALLAFMLVVSALFPALEQSAVSEVLFGLVILGIPVSCGIAITRYRLYDIDRVINRTLVYATLTALLVG